MTANNALELTVIRRAASCRGTVIVADRSTRSLAVMRKHSSSRARHCYIGYGAGSRERGILGMLSCINRNCLSNWRRLNPYRAHNVTKNHTFVRVAAYVAALFLAAGSWGWRSGSGR